MCDTYNCDYLKHSIFRFNLIDFQLNTAFPSQFYVFYSKNHLASLKDRFSRKCLQKELKPVAFSSQNYIGSGNYFTLIENKFRFLR